MQFTSGVPHVDFYAERYIDYLFDKTPKPVLGAGIVLKSHYEQMSVAEQIKLHMAGVLIMPFIYSKDGKSRIY